MASLFSIIFREPFDDERIDWQAVLTELNRDEGSRQVLALETVETMRGVRGIQLKLAKDLAPFDYQEKLIADVERAVGGVVFGPRIERATHDCQAGPFPSGEGTHVKRS